MPTPNSTRRTRALVGTAVLCAAVSAFAARPSPSGTEGAAASTAPAALPLRHPAATPPPLGAARPTAFRAGAPASAASLGTVAGRRSGQFVEAPEFAPVTAPLQTAAGDFDGDGLPDLVVGSYASSVSVLLGKPNGGFGAALRLDVHDDVDGVAGEHWAVATGDLNGDGLDDFVVSSIEAAHLTVFLSEGGGRFRLAGRLPGIVSFGLKLRDVDGDGRVDVVAADFGSNGADGKVIVLPGRGDGTFAPRREYTVGVHPDMVAVGDVDGDGLLDLMSANSGGDTVVGFDTVSLLLGKKGGGYKPKTDFPVGLHPQSVTLADVNADGRLDAIAANLFEDSVSVLLNIGNGRFAPAATYATGVGPVEVVAADVDADGRVDLVTVNDQFSNTSVLRGLGSGAFAPHEEYGAGQGSFGIAVADFDGDKRLDIAVTNYFGGSVSLQYGRGNASFVAHREYFVGAGVQGVAPVRFGTQLGWAVSVACGERNPEPTTCDLPGYIQLIHPDGKGGYKAMETYPTGGIPGNQAGALVALDLNRDGIDDIAEIGDAVSVYLRNRAGQAVRTDHAVGAHPTGLAAADLNGDGFADLVASVHADDGHVAFSVLLGRGDGSFLPAADVAGAASAVNLAIGDMNGDGWPDVVTTGYNSQISIFFGRGDGSFGTRADIALGSSFGPSGVALGDLNHDGLLDVVVANANGGAVAVFLGSGGGRLATPATWAIESGGTAVALADFDRDGHPDITVAMRGIGKVALLRGRGDGTFGTAEAYGAGGSPGALAIADADGDGFPDLAVAPNGYQLVVLKNTGRGGKGVANPSP